jgi:two-component system, OmpR family, sensor kinase
LGLKPILFRSIPWLLLSAVLLPAVATAIVGIVILALWSLPGDIALGVLTVCFGVFTLAGAITCLVLLIRQNTLIQAREELVAHASHELKTPLAAIRLYVDTLRFGRVRSEEETVSCLQTLDREAARLEALVSQLLELRRVSGRYVDSERALTSVEPLVRDALRPLMDHPTYKDRITLDMGHSLPDVEVDPSGFEEALRNLAHNALVHGGAANPVEVEVNGVGSYLVVVVRDHGPGISVAEREHVFQRFYRGKDASDGDLPGLGIGLSIVRAFAKRHGGAIRLDESPGGGCTFTLRLPAA